MDDELLSAYSWKRLSRKQLLHTIHSILTYQFDEVFADAFMQEAEIFTFQFSKRTHKIKYIYLDNVLQATYLPNWGYFSITIDAAARIIHRIPPPKFRVQVVKGVSEFIKEGKSVFCKHVRALDESLRMGDQAFVVDVEDNLLAIGKLELPPHYITQFEVGVAVNVKKGINKIKKAINS